MGTVNAGLFSSTSDDWPTPSALFDALDEEFHFTLDSCASPENAKCSRYFTVEINGLEQEWDGTVWCNPPYGRQIKDWVRKGYEASRAGATVVMLIPARTDTAYWHDFIMQAAEIRLLRGRLHFEGARHLERIRQGESVAHNAPFPSAIVIFRPRPTHLRVVGASSKNGQPDE